MKRIINYKDFNIFRIEKNVWDIDYHNHNFYEIILIEEGEGIHCLNQVRFPYEKNDVFLLTPSDAHKFEIYKKTKFIYLKYTENFLLSISTIEKNHNWKETLKLTLSQKQVFYESVIKNKLETENIVNTAKILLSEFQNRSTYRHEMINFLFSAVMTILVRNLNKIWTIKKEEKIEKILSYLNVYVLDHEKIKIKNLAREFIMSENYISLYVKKNTGFSIQYHIIQNKVNIAEKLLIESQLNINEISEEIGFNDASHFNKFFKKHRKISPSEYRQLWNANNTSI